MTCATLVPGTASELFFSLSPPPCQPASWSLDSAAITNAMFAAEDFIWIEVMDYMPALVYVEPSVYWNTIDNAIRKASYKYDRCRATVSVRCSSCPSGAHLSLLLRAATRPRCAS